jgi:hypothetical protein
MTDQTHRFATIIDADAIEDDSDPLAPARGILIGCLMGAAFWAIPLAWWLL